MPVLCRCAELVGGLTAARWHVSAFWSRAPDAKLTRRPPACPVGGFASTIVSGAALWFLWGNEHDMVGDDTGNETIVDCFF